MPTHRTLAATCVAALFSTSAFGLTQTVLLELDLADLQPGGGFTAGVTGTPPFSPAYNVTLAEGDEFDFTIRFKNNGIITAQGLSFIWAFSFSSGNSTDVTGTGTFSFLDTTGAVFFSSTQKSSQEGQVHFGQQFFNPADFSALPDPITFGGIRYTGTLNDYLEPGVTERTYSEPAFFFNARSYTTGTAVGVPDHSLTALLLGLGLVPLVGVRRRPARQ